MNLGAGVAKIFKEKFGSTRELLKQNQGPGGLAVLKSDNRFVCCLVTKYHYWEKPTLKALWTSLHKLRDFVVKIKINKLAIPRLGCAYNGK